jgi:LPXTG-motif cell wall-anchored protein
MDRQNSGQNNANPPAGDQSNQSGNNAASSSDQSAQNAGAAANSDQSQSARHGKKLPQTASPLPLFALFGIGLIGAGVLARRRILFNN